MNPLLLAAWLAVSAGAQDEAAPEQEQLSEPSGSGPADSAPAGPDPGEGTVGGGEGEEQVFVDPRLNNPTRITGISAASGDADASAENAVGVGSGDYYSAEELASGPGADSVKAAPVGKTAKAGKGKVKPVKAAAAVSAPKVAKAAPPKKPAAPAAPLAVPLTPVAPFNP